MHFPNLGPQLGPEFVHTFSNTVIVCRPVGVRPRDFIQRMSGATDPRISIPKPSLPPPSAPLGPGV